MKIKNLIVAGALLLVTAGVFAGRAKFAPADVYADVAGTKVKLVTNTTFNDLSTNAIGNQAKIIGSGGTTSYNLYTFESSTSTYVHLYTQSF